MNALKNPISITALSSISALGSEREVIKRYQEPTHNLQLKQFGEKECWVGALPKEVNERINFLRDSDSKYRNLDDSVLYAIYSSRSAVQKANWGKGDRFGINIGSSRGATGLFEEHHTEFLSKGKAQTLASPTTTLGNISSWVAHDLQSKGPVISHSITCSTALHGLLNAVAWLQSGLADKFLVGGSEAPLTAFTIAQMRALKVYSKSTEAYPCRALDLNKITNTMVLGEGASMACLEMASSKNALAKIIGIGYATETLQHNVSISADARCFQDSMKMALGTISPNEIDAVVMHAPGTIKGDQSEVRAIEKVFQQDVPFLTTNKWKVGHTFGASGMLSIEMAILMLDLQASFPVPFHKYNSLPKRFEKILVNAVGFGGNAVSILLSK